MTIKAHAKSVIGGREANQDSFLVWEERALFAVADGVGGGLKGDVASRMAVEGLKALPPGSQDLRTLFEKIQESVLQESIATLGDALMGTTLTAAMIIDGSVNVCHVGDSRCYLYADGALQLLTVDHELFDESIGGAVLSSYMGIPSDIHPLTIHEQSVPITAGNRLIICSDGLYKQVLESRMARLIEMLGHNGEELLETLVSEAAKVPYSDNVTAIYLAVE